jgi:hypothetical protein
LYAVTLWFVFIRQAAGTDSQKPMVWINDDHNLFLYWRYAMKLSKQVLTLVLCCLLVRFTAEAESFGPAGQSIDQAGDQVPTPSAQQTPQELQQLVAPIALYPDALVAEILAASTYPAEIVEADHWMQSHSNLKGDELAKEVDKQPWDPSVKALAQFPSVLENMDKNLSWTSSLGDAFANQRQDVTNAVQTLRQQAYKKGNLNSNEQERVTNQGNTIVIEPANPNVVYVPQYDPWLAYGDPIIAYPGWYPEPGLFLAGVGIGFGVGFGVGFFGGFGWGWHNWGYDWYGRSVIYNHNTYISHSRTIANRNNFSHNNFNHNNFNHGNFNHGGFDHADTIHGGSSSFHAQPGTHSSAFSGFDHGGNIRGFSSRGRSSFGGGGGFHGGFHGGGGRR